VLCCVAVPVYAVQRFFFHASLHVFFPALLVALGTLLERNYVWASVSFGIAVACVLYRRAFYESRDVRRPTGTPQKQDPEQP